ncbi:hypothetical protein LOTGIDRAFT_160067 [Lottia gigantea]|uniref:CCHC-type domain-containing protein n=1 Tax=Lottia gigantea TaxID=225164 RepID=V4AMT1_LOTGI|nr:hypothetical protein LOTGIDRAFT_160067 [Lottia gigantea]ESO96080.1 hypothetical protein LOTGIDRAFT_160067 [Lottia gigantea]
MAESTKTEQDYKDEIDRLKSELATSRLASRLTSTPVRPSESLRFNSPFSLPSTSNTTSSSATKSVVYIDRTREPKKFKGILKTSGDLTVHEWIEDIQEYVSTLNLTGEDEARFIYSHLEGDAKEEVKLRKAKGNASLIYDAIRSTFSETHSTSHLLKLFYERTQKKDESIREFSYALRQLMERIQRKEPNKIEFEITIRDHFADGLYDAHLRKELKRQIRDNPSLSFIDIRKFALDWTEEESKPKEKVNTSATSEEVVTTNTQMDELRKLIQTQQGQIDKLQNLLTRRSTGKCFECNRTGHIRRNCPDLKRKQEN